MKRNKSTKAEVQDPNTKKNWISLAQLAYYFNWNATKFSFFPN